MRQKRDRATRRTKLIEKTGVLSFSILFAIIIQCAVLIFAEIHDKADNITISIVMLLVIIFLAVIATICDAIRRKISVDRPTEKILEATKRIANGDLTTRVEISSRYGNYTRYDLIGENINKMALQLSRNEMLSSDFIAGVSHEMKTPLAVIKNYTKSLEDQSLDLQTREKYSKAVIEATDKLNALIVNVLKLTKLENSEITPERKSVRVHDVIAECIFELEQRIEAKNISLNCEVDEVEVLGDAGLISLVFNNLLSNAVKFTPDGGTVTVKLSKLYDKALIEVSDTGVGISKEDGQRIFDKFYQADRSRRQEGNGLGLALVKKAIDVCGGKITVSSEIGKGSTFSVMIGDVKVN